MPRYLPSRRAILLTTSLALVAGWAAADDKYPSRPIRIVVGSEPGSAPDVLARVLANELGPLLGQAVIVENRPGAAGTIGAAAVATAAADGYTLLMGTLANVSLAPSFYPVKYDPVKGFTAVGMVASVPLVLVASPALQASDYRQFAEKMKKANQVSYSSPGVGGPQHMAGVLLQRQIGVPMVHVPYKSGAAATTAVVAGEVQFAFVGTPAAASLVSSRKLTPILVTAQKRSSTMPDVPSASEAGLRGFEIDNWHALLAPAGLPGTVTSVLEGALQKALASATVQEQFQKLGAEPAPGTGKQLESHVAAETARWSKLVTDNKLKAE